MKNHDLSRRTFLAMAGAMPFAASLLAQTKKVPVGLELYSVRGELKKDPKGTVPAVADMGYKVVEFYSPYASWTADEAKDYRKLLDDLGIKCLSTHNRAQASRRTSTTTVSSTKSLARRRSSSRAPRKNRYRRQLEGCAATSPRGGEADAAGMATGFHNHQTEWRPVGDTERWTSARRGPRTSSYSSTAAPASKWARIPPPQSRPIPGGSTASTARTGAKAKGAATRGVRRRRREVEALLDAAESVGDAEYYPMNKRTPAPSASSLWSKVPRELQKAARRQWFRVQGSRFKVQGSTFKVHEELREHFEGFEEYREAMKP